MARQSAAATSFALTPVVVWYYCPIKSYLLGNSRGILGGDVDGIGCGCFFVFLPAKGGAEIERLFLLLINTWDFDFFFLRGNTVFLFTIVLSFVSGRDKLSFV